jgi:hypothetical protein
MLYLILQKAASKKKKVEIIDTRCYSFFKLHPLAVLSNAEYDQDNFSQLTYPTLPPFNWLSWLVSFYQLCFVNLIVFILLVEEMTSWQNNLAPKHILQGFIWTIIGGY